MPFSEQWSEAVYQQLIVPAADDAGFRCHRADAKVGDIRKSIWRSLLDAGVVIADISDANVNVFYELGLTHGLGKDTVLLKRRDTRLPADCEGFLYLDYDPENLESAREHLKTELADWARRQRADGARQALDKVSTS